MKSILSLIGGVALASFVAVGCSQQAAAPAASTASSSKPAAQEQKPSDQGTPAAAENKNAPEPTAAPRTDDANSVTITATDANGKTVNLDFQNIYFDYDKYTIRADAKPAVSHDATELNKVPNLNITIEGHCDERGTTEYNLALGEHRAVAVMNALSSAGVKKARLKTVSYGKEKPADPGHDEAAWAKNRRGVIRES